MGDYFGGNIKEKLDIIIRKKGIRKKDIINSQGGLIPVYDHFMQIQKDNVFLIGDAAAQVKASTGGGIVPGLIAAEGLKNAIIKKKDYKNQIKKLRKELLIHRVVRHMLDNFKNEDWRYLFKLFENKKNKEILASIERENISRLVDPLLKNDPRFLFFIRKIFF